jgi:ubiquinone/menaquinone biosynthesis C-methylase UbiE
MGLRKVEVEKRKSERMPDFSFRMMSLIFKTIDFFYPYVRKRSHQFGIEKGMTVVDYGCGPGRYTIEFAAIVGDKGKVYAVDIHEMAIEAVKKKAAKLNLQNVEPVLVEGYSSSIPDGNADMICAIDMFWIIKQPVEFLSELKRIMKKDGILVVDDGHQPRSETKEKILDSGLWDIVEETGDHLKCKPRL